MKPGIVVHETVVQFGVSSIDRSSPIVGSRQSQWPAKQPVVVLPSADTPPLSVPRNSVKAVPFGVVPGNAVFHVCLLSLSCHCRRRS